MLLASNSLSNYQKTVLRWQRTEEVEKQKQRKLQTSASPTGTWMRCRKRLFCLSWKSLITYSDTTLYPATISAQRRRSQICVNEPRQSSWSIFDASSDPLSPPPLESSRESTNFLRDHFSFALNFLFARLWKSESLKGVKSDQECGTGECHDAAAA